MFMHAPLARIRRSAFTLIEVMFAIIILGLGLTMLAAIFPVAIRQTRDSVDETTAAAIGRAAIAQLQQTLASQNIPTTNGAVQQFEGPERRDLYGNLICSTDPRYAWVPLYRRNNDEPFAQVFVFVVRNRNRPIYEPRIDLPYNPDDTTGNGATLDPVAVIASVSGGVNGSPDLITFEDDLAHSPNRVAVGSFVVVDEGTGTNQVRIYRIADVENVSTNTWRLAPGGAPIQGSELTGVTAYIMGRGYVDPTDPSQGYTGPAQDIAVYSGFVAVR
ncbi:hypothetical protein BH10PLA1_BH10PLA1_05880 [soil metagenome]